MSTDLSLAPFIWGLMLMRTEYLIWSLLLQRRANDIVQATASSAYDIPQHCMPPQDVDAASSAEADTLRQRGFIREVDCNLSVSSAQRRACNGPTGACTPPNILFPSIATGFSAPRKSG